MTTFSPSELFSRIASISQTIKSFDVVNKDNVFDYKEEENRFIGYVFNFDIVYIVFDNLGDLHYFTDSFFKKFDSLKYSITFVITKESYDSYTIHNY